jgi:hypothetical protein
MKRAYCFAVIVALMSLSGARAQAPEESEVVNRRDWEGMLRIAVAARTAGDADLARRKFLEAWNYASFWAVYDPDLLNSGSRRPYGIRGMQRIRAEGAGAGLDDAFRQLDDLLAENPPRVFAGGEKNDGVMKDPDNNVYVVRQNGGRVTAESVDPEDGFTVRFEGRGFNGATMQLETSIVPPSRPGSPAAPALSLRGVVTFDGNRLTGTLRDSKGGTFEFEAVRTWRATK